MCVAGWGLDYIVYLFGKGKLKKGPGSSGLKGS